MKIIFLICILLRINSLYQEQVILSDETFLVTEIETITSPTVTGFSLKGLGMPTDFFNFLPQKPYFAIILNQGRLNEVVKTNVLDFESRYSMYENPSGYLVYATDTKNLNKNFLDVVVTVFKLPATSILDKTNLIAYKSHYMLSDVLDRPCTEHLDAIKDILPHFEKKSFAEKINYETFSESDYKSIKIIIKTDDHGNLILKFSIIYKIPQVLSNIQSSKPPMGDNSILTERYMKGSIYGFSNFQYTQEVTIRNNVDELTIIDVIPIQLDILYSSIQIDIIDSSGTRASYIGRDIANIVELEVQDKIQTTNNLASFSYEGKKSLHLIFKLLRGDVRQMTLSYQLRKKMTNFESIDNENEYGYIFPIGAVVIRQNEKEYVIPTNQIYFNLPYIDAYQPFNTIALSWMIYAVILIQIINLFLGHEKSKSLLQTIKDRFIAKWGWLFGK
jgi:hypothetical protein